MKKIENAGIISIYTMTTIASDVSPVLPDIPVHSILDSIILNITEIPVLVHLLKLNKSINKFVLSRIVALIKPYMEVSDFYFLDGIIYGMRSAHYGIFKLKAKNCPNGPCIRLYCKMRSYCWGVMHDTKLCIRCGSLGHTECKCKECSSYFCKYMSLTQCGICGKYTRCNEHLSRCTLCWCGEGDHNHHNHCCILCGKNHPELNCDMECTKKDCSVSHVTHMVSNHFFVAYRNSPCAICGSNKHNTQGHFCKKCHCYGHSSGFHKLSYESK